MSEFTKDKWEYHEYIPEGITLNGTEYLISSEGEDIALACNEADARLIANAPEMYRLLIEMCKINITNPTAVDKVVIKAYELIDRIDSKGGEC